MTVYDPDRVTPEWLTSVLGVDGGRVSEFDAKDIGTGQVGNNVRFRLGWEPEGAGPASIVCKFASHDETSRTTASRRGPTRPRSPSIGTSPTPSTSAGPTATSPIMFQERLTSSSCSRTCRPPSRVTRSPDARSPKPRLAVDEAAKLHGPRWGDRTLMEVDWLAKAFQESAGMGGFLPMVWPGFVDRYRETLHDGTVELGERLIANVAQLAGVDPGPLTVCHFDYRLDNMLFASPEGGRPLTVVDWQTVRLGLRHR